MHFTRVPGVLLQPLGHLSIKNLSKNLTIFSKINQNCSKIMYNFNLFLQNSQRKLAKAKPCSLKCGSVAQLVEHHLDMVVVVGSSPIGATIYFLNFFLNLCFSTPINELFDDFAIIVFTQNSPKQKPRPFTAQNLSQNYKLFLQKHDIQGVKTYRQGRVACLKSF